jgi:hypothetical protein
MSENVEVRSIHTTVAGFIVWLAAERIPSDARAQCPSAIERFLRWQTERRAVGADFSSEAFLAQLRDRGMSDHERAMTSKVIEYFRRYLATVPV